jgi:hypothetical protein
MPKEPRAKEGTTPKKRSRKTNSAPQNGNGVPADQPLTTSPAIIKQGEPFQSLEDKIRERAYALYLQRNGNGGSPEQDWQQATREICGEQQTA